MTKRIADWRLPFADKFITGHYGTLSDFRKARNMQPHSGTDWARPTGTRIPAIAAGTVQLVQFSKVLGWVLVQSAMDNKGLVWFLGYCHMDQKPGYEVGAKLAKGQTVGLVGNTGVSSGAHLHATASRTVRGVFGATAQKVDLYKLIQANIAPSPASVQQSTQHQHECKHCGEVFK